MIQRIFLLIFIVSGTMSCSAQNLELARGNISDYKIYLPANPSKINTKAAGVLQDYFFRVTGARISIENESKKKPGSLGFHIGGSTKEITTLPDDGFIIRTLQKNIWIAGKGRGTLYGVYSFIEKYLGCRKWDAHAAFSPKVNVLSVPAVITDTEKPIIRYREVYLPASFDDEYLDWHKLQRFEKLWGVWGHSFFKLVSPKLYFKDHPEYFSLVNEERKPMQLCLSNAAVLKITVDNLTKLMAENPEARYWSISANDDIGNCECIHCKKLDDADGGPQGSLLYFVNAVAARFPDKVITTLAYGYSARATEYTRPAANVAIMLSSIDAYRTKPLEKEETAAAFRNNLQQWRAKAANLFVWDYCTQFTNYLTPFPVTNTFPSNVDFFVKQGITGVFEQGSGDTYSEMHELKAYVFAKLLWNTTANADSITQEFLNGYYGKAAPVIAEYLSALQKKVTSNGTRLDIYGNPVNDHTGYLSPANMDLYSDLMDRAEQLVENDRPALLHVQAIRLSQEYVYLQQAKFYGKDQHGVFVKNEAGVFATRPGLPERVERFTAMTGDADVKEFSEGGISPARYAAQWLSIFKTGPGNNLAANASVTLTDTYALEYPAKKERTLVDETPGYEDFSYNWLCFYDTDMEATLDMGMVKKVNNISMHFLEDARHWIFRPSRITVEVSVDGQQYEKVNTISHKMMDEDYTVNFLRVGFEVDKKIQFIRVKATNWPWLPDWRYHKYKKPMIACDEIWVE